MALPEDQLATLLTNAAAAGKLPDVVAGVPAQEGLSYAQQGVFNAEAAQQVIDELGPDTFSQKAIDLVSLDGTATIVPSDGWGQLLIYRKDLFKKAGIDAPETLEDVRAAAEKLNGGDMAGIVLATAPGDGFTAETFEHVALAKGCELVDDGGTVTIDSPECVDALTYYGDLASNFSVEGNQDVDSTRGTYFAGRAAMMFWSPFLLDGMAGPARRHEAVLPGVQEEPGLPGREQRPRRAAQQRGRRAEPVRLRVRLRHRRDATTSTRRRRVVEYLMTDGYVALAGAVAAGQVPRPRGRRGGPGEVQDRVGRAGERRGHQGAAVQVLRPGLDRLARRGGGQLRALGLRAGTGRPARRDWPASSRSRARWRPWWAARDPAEELAKAKATIEEIQTGLE